ncbi:Protein HIT1 [Nakaseomyces bracarensis]|uniref:Protein HIT1 n=1 Tax=Nakaseomyces bracarensis TaxID=273131 RepID=A0ABR4NTM7_9SACH
MNSNEKRCQICKENDFKYKCPKCSIKYCSLACYKNSEMHIHKEEEEEDQVEKKGEQTNGGGGETENDKKQLKTESYRKIYDETLELQELLKYNTVKFHLAKIHKIMTTKVADLNDSSTAMTTEAKKQLAIEYLNTLRYGGIHYNEAIEEFCQQTLSKLET